MSDTTGKRKYYGKYRGVVFDNADPEFRGRIQALVSDVLGMVPTTWALPCLPLTGMMAVQSGAYFLPALDANVWIEFEHGDVNRPIWTGCFWGSQAQVPAVALLSTPETAPIVLQTVGMNTVWIGGDPATGITLCCGPAVSPTSPQIKISQTGIVISDGHGGTIVIGAGTVMINNGAILVK